MSHPVQTQMNVALVVKPCGCHLVATASETNGGVWFRWCHEHDPRLDDQTTMLPAPGSDLPIGHDRSSPVAGSVIDDACGDPSVALLTGGTHDDYHH